MIDPRLVTELLSNVETFADSGEPVEQAQLEVDWNDPLERARRIWTADPTELDWR